MSNKPENAPVSLEELNKAIDLVGILMAQVTIPGNKAQTWVAAGEVLGVLKEFLADQQKKVIEQKKAAEAALKAEAERKAQEEATNKALADVEAATAALAQSQSESPDLTVVPSLTENSTPAENP